MLNYYRARAREYEQVYAKPERLADLARLDAVLPEAMSGRRVLEVACGTGYWTRRIGRRAARVIAYDLAPETLDVARSQQPPEQPVEYRLGDAFDLPKTSEEFDAGFAGFWWSHVRLEDLDRFLRGFHARLAPGSIVTVVDNRYVEGSNSPITRTDAAGNSFQRRRLNSGEQHEVLKNFPSPSQVAASVERVGGADCQVTQLSYYWYATYFVHGPRTSEAALPL